MIQRSSKFFVIYILMSLAIIGIVIFMGSQTIVYRAEMQDKAEIVRAESVLDDVESIIMKEIQKLETTLEEFTLMESFEMPAAVENLFQIEYNQLVYPDIGTQLTHKEQEFIEILQPIMEDRGRLNRAYPREDGKVVTKGWYLLYHQNLPVWIYWMQTEKGITGYQISYIYPLTEILNRLADLKHDDSVVVIEENGNLLFQQQENRESNQLYAEKTLDFPLSYWQLKYYSPPYQPFWIYLLGAFFIGIFVLSIIWFLHRIYREYEATKRTAEQQVNFVSQVSHELKTPLTNISLFSELLKETNASIETNQYSGIIHSESLRLSRLIQNILNFTKARKMHFSEIDLVETLQNLYVVFEPSFTSKNLKLNLRLPEKCKIYSDQDAIIQIVSNFLSNAEKYGAMGEKVDLSLMIEEKIVIEVRDYGTGISGKYLQKIFTPFFRIHSNITEGVAGTGIGLTISAKLAEAIHGEITVHPQEQGVAFRLTL